MHGRRDELDAVVPSAFGTFVALPDDNGGVAGVHGEIAEGDALLELEIVFENDHAAIGVDDAGMGFNLDALPITGIPLETYGHARVHAMCAALFFVEPAGPLRLFLCGR